MRICRICGDTEETTRVYGDLCRKHYLQMKRHGKILEHTIYDPNPIEVIDNIAYMKCFDKYGNETCTTKFDAKYVDKVKNIKWYRRISGSKNHKIPYIMGSISPNEKIFLHRFLLDVPEGKFIDHIDHDTMNNLESNIRICESKENARNRSYKSSRPYPGVYQQYGPNSRWTCSITINYKTIHLGTFDTVEEAIKVRKEAEKKHFGDYVYTGHKK